LETIKIESGVTESNAESVISERISASSFVQHRSSLHQIDKPTLPTRRVSAIATENYDECESSQNEDLENLPPPPAFLLEGSSPPSAAGSPASQRRYIIILFI
jgi:hypothetical protein